MNNLYRVDVANGVVYKMNKYSSTYTFFSRLADLSKEQLAEVKKDVHCSLSELQMVLGEMRNGH